MDAPLRSQPSSEQSELRSEQPSEWVACLLALPVLLLAHVAVVALAAGLLAVPGDATPLVVAAIFGGIATLLLGPVLGLLVEAPWATVVATIDALVLVATGVGVPIGAPVLYGLWLSRRRAAAAAPGAAPTWVPPLLGIPLGILLLLWLVILYIYLFPSVPSSPPSAVDDRFAAAVVLGFLGLPALLCTLSIVGLVQGTTWGRLLAGVTALELGLSVVALPVTVPILWGLWRPRPQPELVTVPQQAVY